MILSFDVGLKYAVLAVGQFFTCDSRPLVTLKVIDYNFDWIYLKELITFWKIDIFIFGYPYGCFKNNIYVIKFINEVSCRLCFVYKKPIYFVDEFLSTWESNFFLTHYVKNCNNFYFRINSISASLILNRWFYLINGK